MQQIKKTLLTLVALLALTTQAWADYYVSGNGSGNWCNGEGWSIADANKMTESNGIYSITFANVAVPEGENGYQFKILNNDWSDAYGTTAAASDIKLNRTLQATSANNTQVNVGNITFTITATSDVTISFNPNDKTFMISTTGMKVGDDANTFFPVEGETNQWKLEAMPAGNVIVDVEYFDLATLADKGLTAAEDAAANTEAPLAVLAENAVTGGTLMYYVNLDANFTQADAIALPEDKWDAAIPTAEELNPAGGTYYVWYYIKGDDEHSDTDPQRLTVTVLPEPTYTVEFADDTAEPDKWKAEPAADVKKGQTVTVTYTGTKKVIGVKAEKKAKPTLATALKDGAVVKIDYTWDGVHTIFTFTNNGGTYSCTVTGNSASNFTASLTKNGETLTFVATNDPWSDANLNIDFYATDNGFYFNQKGSYYQTFTISVNGTDVTSQLSELK